MSLGSVVAIRSSLEVFERCLNIAGYIPGVGTISGQLLRGSLATIETISGVALVILAAVPYSQGSIGGQVAFNFGVALIGHGILNGVRITVEYFPGVSLFTALPYDICSYVLLGRRLFSYV